MLLRWTGTCGQADGRAKGPRQAGPRPLSRGGRRGGGAVELLEHLRVKVAVGDDNALDVRRQLTRVAAGADRGVVDPDVELACVEGLSVAPITAGALRFCVESGGFATF